MVFILCCKPKVIYSSSKEVRLLVSLRFLACSCSQRNIDHCGQAMAFGSIVCCGARHSDRKKKAKKDLGWRIFSLKELHAATNNFNYDNKLGEGAFGSVYWGQLWDGSQIAVKRLKVWSDRAETEFSVEVEILGRVRHKNLLTLRGYCSEGQERLIVYDYMQNLSLLSHLHGQHSSECLLDWNRRVNIAIGSAEGIAYLHNQATPHIIHRDIKASNILLDHDFQAKVADFGFAKFIPDGATHVTTKVKGTLGYLAPEYAMLGKAKESIDVYSYGILLLELVTGRRPLQRLQDVSAQSIAEWTLPFAREKKLNEVVDPKLNGEYVEEELRRLVIIGLMCAQKEAEKRPTITEVVAMLKGDAKGKMDDVENSELFKGRGYGGGEDFKEGKGGEDASDTITEEKSDTITEEKSDAVPEEKSGLTSLEVETVDPGSGDAPGVK